MTGPINPQKRLSIPTEYKGITFRSKLEADWAFFLDALRMRWEYEPQGRIVNGVFTLCDFRFPDLGQWLEIKGVWTPAEHEKYEAFARAIAPAELFIGGPKGVLGTFTHPAPNSGGVGVWNPALVHHCNGCHAVRFRLVGDYQRCPCDYQRQFPDHITQSFCLIGEQLRRDSVLTWPAGQSAFADDLYNWLYPEVG